MIEVRRRPAAKLTPLVLATMTSQALLVVLAPTIAAISDEFGTSVAVVGQARTVAAAVGVAASLLLTARIGSIGAPRLLRIGAVLTLASCAASAAAPSLALFLASQLLVGVGFAYLLTAGFAGVAAFSGQQRAWALGHVAAANALAWIIVNPVAGAITQWLSWRGAYAVVALLGVATLASARTAADTAEAGPTLPLRVLVRDRSARWWLLSELLAYTCWTSLLTFAGAFFIERLGAGEAVTGWLLAAGAAAYVVAASGFGGLVARTPLRLLTAGAALGMAGLLPVMLGSEAFGVVVATTLFCLIGVAAGVRTPASSGLGLAQLPRHAGAMMAIRTGVTQLGYLLGAVVGGVVIATAGFGALGGVLGAGMAVSALLLLRVREPTRPRDDSP